MQVQLTTEDYSAEYEALPKRRTSRIAMNFIKHDPANDKIPDRMPPTLVYWNRCTTRVNEATQSLVAAEQLLAFQSQRYCFHSFKKAVESTMGSSYPFFPNKPMWQDPQQQDRPTKVEIFALKDENNNPRDWKSMLSFKPTEATISIESTRLRDVFFNSNFESGNLKQAFIIPQDADFEAENEHPPLSHRTNEPTDFHCRK